MAFPFSPVRVRDQQTKLMRSGLCSRLIAALVIFTMVGVSLVPRVAGQEPSNSVVQQQTPQQQTRPRRATTASQGQTWPAAGSDAIEIETTRLKSEPLM